MKQFHKVKVQKPKKSTFDLSHERKFTMNFGDLVPCFLQEVVPSDKFQVNFEAMVRLMPLLSPIIHRINVHVHFFFVPYRILWNDFEKFITGQNDELVFPQFQGNFSKFATVHPIGSLGDYLGLPSDRYEELSASVANAPNVSQMPFRAYYKIWYDYYRDQNLQTGATADDPNETIAPYGGIVNVDDDGSYVNINMLRKRAWEKDYFTSCLPSAQRGDAVTFPLLGSAPVEGRPNLYDVDEDGYMSGGSAIGTGPDKGLAGEDYTYMHKVRMQNALGNTDPLVANLDEAASTTVNDLRRSFALQRWLEKSMRMGERYAEQLLSRFGVKSSDARLQRPEFLGGGKLPVQIAEVVQSSQTDTTPQGTLTGKSLTGGRVNGFTRFFEEHGIVLGIMSITPRTAYQQGIPRIFSKFDKFDYLEPMFAHIGEQEVTKKELFVGESGQDDVFGYQERYAEYRFAFDSVHGTMRDSLDFWHMGRKFSVLPSLSEDFIVIDNTTTNRPFPVEFTEDKIIVQTYADVKAIRPLPKFGTPI